MRSGDFDRTITLWRKTVTQNAYGEEVETWAEHLECKAEVRPIQAWERFRSEKIVSQLVNIFKIRWYSDIDIEDRVYYDSKYWDITGVAELGRRKGVEITAEVIT